MNNDYLFDKTGTDAEIEMLENALAAYRITPVAPAFARTEQANRVETSIPGLRFSLFYASIVTSFAVLVIIAVSAIAWLDAEQKEAAAVPPSAVVSPPPAVDDFVAIDRPVASKNSDRFEVKQSRPQAFQKVIRRRPLAASVTRDKRTTVPPLTAEEKYAYDQVRLALWIAGSKLKVVPDTINRSYDAQDNMPDKQ